MAEFKSEQPEPQAPAYHLVITEIITPQVYSRR